MKKIIWGGFLIAACSACALDLTTNDGTTYKNVSISSVTPVGFDICYTPEKGGLSIREVLFTDLPEKWRKEYHYSPEAAAEFTKKVDDLKKLKAEEMKKRYQQWVANQEEEDNLHAAIYAGRLNIILKSLRATPFGCVAWADSAFSTQTTGHYGKVIVLGVFVDNGGEWAGNIYPAGYSVQVSEGFLPVYTTSLEQAIMLARSNQYIKEDALKQ